MSSRIDVAPARSNENRAASLTKSGASFSGSLTLTVRVNERSRPSRRRQESVSLAAAIEAKRSSQESVPSRSARSRSSIPAQRPGGAVFVRAGESHLESGGGRAALVELEDEQLDYRRLEAARQEEHGGEGQAPAQDHHRRLES